jgi:hypothetical protein
MLITFPCTAVRSEIIEFKPNGPAFHMPTLPALLAGERARPPCSAPGELVVAGLVRAAATACSGSGASLVTVTADFPHDTRSTATPMTPPRFLSSPVTACKQCSQVMPVTW